MRGLCMNKNIYTLSFFVLLLASFLTIRNLQTNEVEEVLYSDASCADSKTQVIMTWEEAKIIAEKSYCVSEGTLGVNYMCNPITGTFWIDLNVEKPGCLPACVIDINTKIASINWRCTGLIN